ncbi:MAG: hypothetical protein LBL73_07085 [Synergistaceae bacterium]|nr:hypothetical protein [Synergistaceae bacterium]
MSLRLFHNADKVLGNPRWLQTFSLIKTTRAPDEHGRAVVSKEEVTARGVIQPSAGEDLDRLPDGDRGMQSVTVWTAAPLSSGTPGELPDEITWRGTRYAVRHVRDWEDYGLGYCRAVCVAQGMKERQPS